MKHLDPLDVNANPRSTTGARSGSPPRIRTVTNNNFVFYFEIDERLSEVRIR
jgi:hypothetical protein